MRGGRFGSSAVLLLAASCAPAAAPRLELAPDLVLRGGEVVTMDRAHPHAHAVAIRSGRVVAVGEDAAISALAGGATRVIELRGRTVLPGLTDAHTHLFALGKHVGEVDLRGCQSAQACAARLKSAGTVQWVLGMGWDQNLFPDKSFPTHQALDDVESARPVWLQRVDGHAGWANARALSLAGVTKDTPDPAGGKIERLPDGTPTGVFVDAARALVDRFVPAPSKGEREEMILRGQADALAHGLTEVHEMGIDLPTIAAYRDLAARGKLAIRVYAFASGDETPEAVLAQPPDPKAGEAMFKLRGIKVWADGALGSRGARLLEPYADEPTTRGIVVTQPEVIEALARRGLATGWQIAVHAIGDAANRSTLDAFERAGCAASSDHRFRIEHAQIVNLADIPRFHSLGVIASMQPTHATSDMGWAEARLGASRMPGAYAWRRFLDAKVTVAGGSDFPVEEVDPIGGGLFSAVTRTNHQGEPRGGFLPDQRMSLDEAISAFTRDAAYAAFEESWRGQVAPGFAADLTVLDRDILAHPAESLRDAKAAMTIVAGRVAFSLSP